MKPLRAHAAARAETFDADEAGHELGLDEDLRERESPGADLGDGRLQRAELTRVHGVVRGQIAPVHDVGLYLHDVLPLSAERFEREPQVGEELLRLRGHVPYPDACAGETPIAVDTGRDAEMDRRADPDRVREVRDRHHQPVARDDVLCHGSA